MTDSVEDFDKELALPVEDEAKARVQPLVDELVNNGALGDDSLGLVFRYPDLKVVFVNAVGRSVMCPTFEGGVATHDFSLRDVIAVGDKGRFEASVNPMLQVTDRWEGKLMARDLWGGDLPLTVRIWNRNIAGLGKHLFFHGDSTRESGLGNMRGWRDRELLLALLAHSKDNIYFKDRESRFLRVSKSLLTKFGLTHPHEVIGKTDFHFFGVSHASAAYEDEKEILRTGKPILEKEELENWDSGEVTWGSTSKLPLYSATGEIVGTFGVTRDITHVKRAEEERKELEVRLQLAQRLEAIGSLAAGVAHEINTPTQFVSDNVSFLGDAFSDLSGLLQECLGFVEKSKGIQELDSDRARILDKIEKVDLDFLVEEIPQTIEQSGNGLRQIAKIVASMKEFSYPSSPEKSKVDLNHAIENTLNVSRNAWKGVAEIDLDLDEQLPEVDCLVDEMNQVMLNLIVNASQAIEATESRQGRIKIKTTSSEDSVFIEVSDTGTGMGEDVKARIFEPFFTTKEVGKGTGQGLAMARNVVVKTHQGTIDCKSELGRGTVFRITLPIEAPHKAGKRKRTID